MKKNLFRVLLAITSLSAVVLLGFNWSNSDLSISDAPAYDFGSVLVGSSAEHTFTITNVSTEQVQFSGFKAMTAPFLITGGTCAPMLMLHPGDSCTAIVTFTPAAVQAYSSALAIDFAERRGGDFSTSRTVTGAGVETGPSPTTTTLPSPTTTLPSPPVTTTTMPAGTVCNQGDATVAYNALPFGGGNCPGSSQAFQAAGVNEFGGGVHLAGTMRKLSQLKVLFASAACQAGTQAGGNCISATGATFNQPVTANIYAVSNCAGVPCPRALLATVTQTLAIPYRPSADAANCVGADAGGWLNREAPTGAHCQQDISVVAAFDFSALNATLPDQVIWTVTFNTTGYGYHPVGLDAACHTMAQGCTYDFLSVGAHSQAGAPYAGTDINSDAAFVSKGHPASAVLSTSGYSGMKPEGEIITQ